MNDTVSKTVELATPDLDQLRARYADERKRRTEQGTYGDYIELNGAFSRFTDDPYAQDDLRRDPVSEDVDVLVVGAGFSGLLAGARLRQAGIENFRIIDKASDFGGTWYWNRYPGAACDVEAYIYMPLLEEMGYVPSEKYAKGPEILEHSRAIGRKFGLYDKAYFQTQVSDVRWNDEQRRWTVSTNRGDKIRARFVMLGSGPLNKVRVPDIPGIESFEGHTFHTSRWDYDYTGGDSAGNMERLGDKRVAVIGTGATGIQCIPHLGASAQHLYVFQRTPSVIESRGNAPTDSAWFAAQAPGWQKKRMENFDLLMAGIPQPEDMIGDRWTSIWATQPLVTEAEAETLSFADQMELTDARKMEGARARIDAIVNDPETAAGLKPYFGRFCKRPCFHDGYLETFNRPNVTLVDTKGVGVERVTPTGLVANGKEYEVDCIVFATGFELGARTDKSGGFGLHGRDGVALGDKWANGVQSVHGILTNGFPNLFVIGGLRQAAITINLPYMFGEQASHAVAMIKDALTSGRETIEVTQAAEAAWGEAFAAKSHYSPAYTLSCTPGSYNGEGKAGSDPLFAGAYGGGPIEYVGLLEEWRRSGIQNDLLPTSAPKT
ncbi:NAD(P)/FAD-dependent oxidoreductase [Brevundimonas sp.]|uniref:flavin-containing monooxygenase n=1 Tax=Brevundimonas sp. TaxID=1871086 RepID=UPI001A2407CA|nr:NAD(P)/FAD-dependent oxidoreductase [Brevundimonas sp.]MBJ7483886.1 NAD(P)/FAD-dependent oxidoreductase [Brevundimonas sp.]